METDCIISGEAFIPALLFICAFKGDKDFFLCIKISEDYIEIVQFRTKIKLVGSKITR